MAPAVHFTHHLCHTNAETPVPDDDFFNKLVRRWPRASGVLYAIPEWNCCRRSVGTSSRFTTDVTRVTCRRCALLLDTGDDHRELMKRAWEICCSKRGVPSPLNQAELDAIDRERRASQVDKLAELAINVSMSALLGITNPKPIAEQLRETIATLVLKLDEDIREAAQPLINEWLLAADVAEVIDERIARSKVLADELRDRITPGIVAARRVIELREAA